MEEFTEWRAYYDLQHAASPAKAGEDPEAAKKKYCAACKKAGRNNCATCEFK